MGWISKRFNRSRSKWGAPISEEKRRAPLRKIVRVIRHRQSLFDHDYVELECSHTALAYGDYRARCVKCLKDADASSRENTPRPRTGPTRSRSSEADDPCEDS